MYRNETPLFNDNNLTVKVQNRDGSLYVSSRDVAIGLGKRHDNIVRDIEKILENSNVSSLIIPASYKVEGQKRDYKEYLLTKDIVSFTTYVSDRGQIWVLGKLDGWIQEYEEVSNV